MRRRALTIAALAATFGATTCAAGPLIFEETTKFTLPGSFTPIGTAVEGDTIIATGTRSEWVTEPYEHEHTYYAAFLFRRQSSGTWTYVRTLAQTDCDQGEIAEDTCSATAAIRNGVAAVHTAQVRIFRRASNGDWVEEPSNAFPGGVGDVAVGTGAVLTSHPVCVGPGLNVFRPNPSGVWTEVFKVTSDEFACEFWGLRGTDVDMSVGNRLITAQPDEAAAYIYEPSGTTWTQTATLTNPLSTPVFLGSVALDDTRAFTSGPREAPVLVFNRVGGAWTHSVNIAPPDTAERGGGGIKVRDLVFVGYSEDLHRGGSVGVFRANASGQYEEVAKLVSSSLQQSSPFGLGRGMDAYVSGSFARVAATGPGGVHVFDVNQLGTTPAPVQEDFELGNSANWTPIAGSSFSVVSSGGSRVFRQSNTTGDAGAFVTHINRTNQAIEADVRPTAFDGTNRWVGLVVRRTDANNYYYLALRQSNVLELKRMVNGAFVTLASTPVSVVLNRNYRLSLEAVGTRLRAYVNGRLAVEASDSVLKQGHAGVQMFRARADFDNVILSPDPHLTLIDHHTPKFIEHVWSFPLGPWSTNYDAITERYRLVQQDTAGDARALTRVAADDQIVQVAATATSFAAGTGSRWFGVVARQVDANNYYYVTVRRDNTISLRKLVNGTVTVLDNAPLTVAAGTRYTLRLAAVGTSLRAYVNGNLVLEATDSSHARGQYGLATFRTAATFDDFLTWEP